MCMEVTKSPSDWWKRECSLSAASQYTARQPDLLLLSPFRTYWPIQRTVTWYHVYKQPQCHTKCMRACFLQQGLRNRNSFAELQMGLSCRQKWSHLQRSCTAQHAHTLTPVLDSIQELTTCLLKLHTRAYSACMLLAHGTPYTLLAKSIKHGIIIHRCCLAYQETATTSTTLSTRC